MKTPLFKLAVYIRYFRYLLWEFRWSLGVFWSVVGIGGFVMWRVEEGLGFLQACHGVFLMIFLESALDFPDEWYLQLAFFLVPIIGLGAVADSLVRLAILTFTSKRRLPEWHRMVISLYRDHTVVVGVGKVGLQIVRELVEMHIPVCAIEREKESEFLEEIEDAGVPVIRGEGRSQKTLEQAGVARAKSIILATDDDLANLDSALTARDVNPDIRVVMRLFDETLAEKVAGAFHMPAISISHVAAPSFIAAATDRKVYQSIHLGDQRLHLIDLTICPTGDLCGVTVGELQSRDHVNVVMHQRQTGVDVNPSGESVLEAGDTLLVIAQLKKLVELSDRNRDGASESK